MYLYLLESDGFYKIGVAKDIETRLGDLQCGNPHKINLVATCKVEQPYHVEWYFHSIFRGLRVHGEWFRLSEDSVELVKETYIMLENDDFSVLEPMQRKWNEMVDRIYATSLVAEER